MTVEPFLFSTRAPLVAPLCDRARPADERVAAVVVDWERRGKPERQVEARNRIGTDTQIGADTPDDLARVAASVDVPVICRLNGPGPHTASEVDLAVALGASEVLVPMIRSIEEVETVLRHARDRIGVGIMVETEAAVAAADRLGRLPVVRAYVGLMDLALDRRAVSIFSAVADGTVERVRERFAVPFGFGGLTLPHRGAPVPCWLFLAEMARLDCRFTFLRRSFMADVGDGDPGAAVATIRGAARAAARRSGAEIEDDRDELLRVVAQLEAAVPAGRFG